MKLSTSEASVTFQPMVTSGSFPVSSVMGLVSHVTQQNISMSLVNARLSEKLAEYQPIIGSMNPIQMYQVAGPVTTTVDIDSAATLMAA